MSNRRRLIAATFVTALAVTPLAHGQGSSRAFGDLLKRVPEQSNVLMLVNVDGLFDSPMGRRENWRDKTIENHRDGLGLASEVSKVAVALGMDFQSKQERWKVGLIQLRRDVPIKLETLAAREGGYVETIEKTPVAWTPRGFYLFDFPDSLVGFATPTNRQELVGWFRSALWHPRTTAPGFADRAIFRADAGAQIALSLDLTHAVSARLVEPWLNSIDEIKKSKIDPNLLATRLASVKSASLVVKVDQGIEGNLRIDFDQDVDYATPVARALILDVLEEFGADLPEMKTWTLNFDKKSAIEMNGRLSVESVRQVLNMARAPRLSPDSKSVAQIPGAKQADSKPSANAVKPETQRPSDNAVAAQSYFRSVTSLIEGLKSTKRPTYRSAKLWYDRYAKQIEELPILGVDKELLDWGAQVSRLLREMASGINYYAQNQSYTLASSPNGYYGGYDGYYGNSKAYDQSTIKTQSNAMMSVDLDKRWQGLETSAADMRRKMVEKYQIDF